MGVSVVEGVSQHRQAGLIPDDAIRVPARGVRVPVKGAIDSQNPNLPRQSSTPSSQGTLSSEPSSPGKSWGVPPLNPLHLRIATLATTILPQSASTSPEPSALVPSAFSSSRRGSASQIGKTTPLSTSSNSSQETQSLPPAMDLAFDSHSITTPLPTKD